MTWRCIGCNAEVPYRMGMGIFDFTCSCGSRILYNDEQEGPCVVPGTLVLTLLMNHTPPHLDMLVGTSNHTSPAKENIIKALQARGAIWRKDCPDCQKLLKRSQEQAVLEAERIIKEGK